MKGLGISKFLALVLLGWLLTASQVRAQNFGFSVTTSSAAVAVNGEVTYNINLTNFTGISLGEVFVTNAFSSAVLFDSQTNSQNLSLFAVTNENRFWFELGLLVNGDISHMSLTVFALTNGFLTNAIVVFSPDLGTNMTITNVVVQVTNTTVLANLAVAISGPLGDVFANDWMTYGVAVTNLGPGTVANVFLTNTLPAGVGFLGVSPTNSAKPTNGVMLLNLGTLASGGFKNFIFTVQPTNAGALPFVASVGAANLQDTNTANNTATTNVTVGSFLTGQLIATNASSMTYDPQTGLMNQTVRLSNIGTSAVASARVIISGLTNRLYNAVGTNNGHPFVTYGAALNTNQSTDLVLEYFVPTRLPIAVSNSFYTAVGISAANLSAPPGTNGLFSIIRKVVLTNGNFLVEFESVLGRSYTIVYSTDASFTSPLYAQPSIIAPADKVQWIDDGPPKTVSTPASAGSRFYRVILNP